MGYVLCVLVISFIYFFVYFWRHDKQSSDTSGYNNSIVSMGKDFHTKVVGVTYRNVDQTSRQTIIKKCNRGDEVFLKPVPTLKFPNAIGVFNTQGQQLGHLRAELAENIKSNYQINYIKATISDITGGGDKFYGCNLHIIVTDSINKKHGAYYNNLRETDTDDWCFENNSRLNTPKTDDDYMYTGEIDSNDRIHTREVHNDDYLYNREINNDDGWYNDPQ